MVDGCRINQVRRTASIKLHKRHYDDELILEPWCTVPIPKDPVKDADDVEPARRLSAGNLDRSNPRLSRFLQNLSHKPNRDPVLNLSDDELMNLPAIPPRANRRDLSVYGTDPASAAATDRALQDERENVVSGNPELDSYAYLTMVLEALAILDRLGPALESISQRISNELFKLVETTIEEASDRSVCSLSVVRCRVLT